MGSAEWSVIAVLLKIGHAGSGPLLAGPIPAVTAMAVRERKVTVSPLLTSRDLQMDVRLDPGM